MRDKRFRAAAFSIRVLDTMRIFSASASHKPSVLSTTATFTLGIAALVFSYSALKPAPQIAPGPSSQTPQTTKLQTSKTSTKFASTKSLQEKSSQMKSSAQMPQTVAQTVGFQSVSAMKSRVAQNRVAGGRILRVGLTTLGGSIVLVSDAPLTISDGAQTGRRLEIAAGANVTFSLGATENVMARGQVFSGAIRVESGGLAYAGWQMPKIASRGVTRMASDGGDPRWRRGYHGNFEIDAQSFSFEPAMHKSALRVVNVLPLDQYLDGVVPWEMDKSAPMEALKAQAICARSETLAKIADGRHARDGFDICDYDHCQGYSGTENENARTNRAVDETSGLVIVRDGRIADAVYGTNSGGVTAASEDVWRGTPEPYLRSVNDFSPSRHRETAQLFQTPMTEAKWAIYCTKNLPSFAQPSAGEIGALALRRRNNARAAALFQAQDLPEFYRWTRVVTPAQMALVLKVEGAVATEVRVLDRSPSGHIKNLQVVGRAPDGAVVFATYEKDSQIRAMFSGRLGSTTALPSSTFVVIAQRDTKRQIVGWVFKGAGWGHGAGMCQRGAQNHALAGWNARQIVNWYFRGVTLARVG